PGKAAMIKIPVTQLFSCFSLLLFLCPSVFSAQATPNSETTSETRSEALDLLHRTLDSYSRTNAYHLEVLENLEIVGPFRRSSDQVISTAIVAPGNRYRFEARAEEVWITQVSGGTTEWLYQPELLQYTQHPAPSPGPGNMPANRNRTAFQLK